ncbi:MAG: hypothetical protein EVA89_08925 [Sandaracinaceae bacterium]|nr:MAG: hypothetical protein EVA89_08925 [Sandaracinaceae bacterium]
MIQLWLFLLMLLLVGGFALFRWYFSADQKARRAMQAVPLLPAARVRDGQTARVIGEVLPGASVTAPLSGRPCTYWRVTVEEQRGGSKNRRWVTIVDEHEGVDFLLRDGDTKALVKTDFVQCVLEKDGKFSSGFLNDATPELDAFLRERGQSSQGLVFNKNMRYREGVVEPGEHVCVVGAGRWERDPDEEASAGTGYRDASMPTRLVLVAPEDGPLLLSDEASMLR